MQAKTVSSPSASIYSDQCSSCDNDDAIEAVYELLSQGRPLAEILQMAKRVVSLNGKPSLAGEPRAGQLHAVPGDTHEDASRLGIASFVQPATSITEKECPLSLHSSAANTAGDTAHNPGALNVLKNRTTASLARFPKVIGVGLFWLIPAVSLTIVATAGKSLIDARVAVNATEAAAPAIPEPAQASEFQSPNSQTEESRPAPVATPEPQRVKPQIQPEEVKALLDRGDALVSMADIASGRLFYERAAALGSAQGALRLAATYDPIFLAQAGLRTTSGDATRAQYWYERARDLGAKDADIPASSQAIDTDRSSGEIVTAAPEVPSTAGTTGQDKDLSANAPPTSGAEQHQAAASTPLPARRKHRYARSEQHSIDTGCPRSGHCLTPR